MSVSFTAVAYCRCSTEKQDESISIQKQEIQKYAKANGYEITRFQDRQKGGGAGDCRRSPGPPMAVTILAAGPPNDA